MNYRKHLFYFSSALCLFTGTTPVALASGGIELSAVVENTNSGRSVYVQPDGSILAAGNTYAYDPIAGSYFTQFAAVRFLSNGLLDTSFNGVGSVATTLMVDIYGSSGGNSALGAIRQLDGKTVLAGNTYLPNEGGLFGLVRYNDNGSLDTSFGGTGKVTTALSTSPFADSSALSVVEQPWDNKIVAAGWARTTGPSSAALVRYNPDGTLDSSFGSSGVVTTAFSTTANLAKSVVTDSANRIVIGGKAYNGTKYNLATARYLSSGALDTSFGGTGKILTTIGAYNDELNSIAIQSDGKIVGVGQSFVKIAKKLVGRLLIVRFNANGTLDSTFGSSGKVLLNLGGSDYAAGVVIRTDGKIVVAGYSLSTTNSNSTTATVRLNTNGSMDSSFGAGGVVLTTVLARSYGNSVTVDSNDKTIVGGTAHDNLGNSWIMVVRYNADGTLDSSF